MKESIRSPVRESRKPEPQSDESMMESNSSNMEEIEPQKLFPSIPPLSERIRKKPESTPIPKSHLEIEASIIESSIEIEAELRNNGEERSTLSTALRELLEAKIEEEPVEMIKIETENELSPALEVNQEKPEEKEEILKISESSTNNIQDIPTETPPIKVTPSPKDVIRLKDPRTCVPKDISTQKMETPIKRKVRMVGLL